MVKCLNIGKNIGKPIYQSITNNKLLGDEFTQLLMIFIVG